MVQSRREKDSRGLRLAVNPNSTSETLHTKHETKEKKCDGTMEHSIVTSNRKCGNAIPVKQCSYVHLTRRVVEEVAGGYTALNKLAINNTALNKLAQGGGGGGGR
ncbi:hypothetical protein T4B_8674, partial [Trichinella pseudospiralis]